MDTKKSDDLLPCPFCAVVSCNLMDHKDDCFMKQAYKAYPNQAQIRDLYNTRPIEDALKEEIERLRETDTIGRTEPLESDVSTKGDVLTTIKKRCPRCFESALDSTYVYCPRCGEVLE